MGADDYQNKPCYLFYRSDANGNIERKRMERYNLSFTHHIGLCHFSEWMGGAKLPEEGIVEKEKSTTIVKNTVMQD